jgi:1-acylglycerone phosphate reductase
MVKVALVTGSNGGIGKALTLELASRGYTVYATDIVFSPESKETFQTKSIRTHIMDVTSQEQVVQVRDIIQADTEGYLDLLYCNAGRVQVGLSSDLTDDEIRSLYELNLFSQMRLVREFVQMIIKAKGTISFSGSVTKGMPLHSNSLYTSSKAALDQYASVLQCELRNYGVKVIDVIGGYIKTNIFDSRVNTIRDGSVFQFPEYEEIYAKRNQVLDKSSQEGMEASEFARRALDKIEKANVDTLRVYEGAKAGRLSFLQQVVPQRNLVDHMLRLFKLNFNYRNHMKD